MRWWCLFFFRHISLLKYIMDSRVFVSEGETREREERGGEKKGERESGRE